MTLLVPPEYPALMRGALDRVRDMHASSDVPVAALVVDERAVVIGEGTNERELHHDPTAHAEIVAIRRAAAQRGNWHLDRCVLVVTLEPCVMCAGAILAARVPVVVFGAWDEKAGAAGSVCDLLRDRRFPSRAEVYGGVLAEECAAAMTNFFRQRR